MPEKRQHDHGGNSGRASPPKDASGPEAPSDRSAPWQEPRGVQKHIADADKVARTGSSEEHVRDTPPAGAWNDTSGD